MPNFGGQDLADELVQEVALNVWTRGSYDLLAWIKGRSEDSPTEGSHDS